MPRLRPDVAVDRSIGARLVPSPEGARGGEMFAIAATSISVHNISN